MTFGLKFEPRDLWVGLYWDNKYGQLSIYICPLPTVCFYIELF